MLDAAETYVNLGVRWYAKGLFEKSTKLGADIKGSTLYRVKAGCFVYNRLFATEGSFAVAQPEHEHGLVSNEFPVYEVDLERLDPGYLALQFQMPEVWEAVALECVGTTKSRSRWKEARFEAFKISLPPLPEQRRIVDLVGAVDDAIYAADDAVASNRSLAAASRERAARGAGEERLASYAFEITMGRQRSPQHAQGEHMTPYLRSANVLDDRLDLSDVKVMNFTLAEQEKYKLVLGDVLVTEGSASESAVGAAAVWDGSIEPTVCFQNTLLRFRAVPGRTISGYVAQWCRWAYESGAFREAASGTNIRHIGSGGAGKMKVSLPSIEVQEQLVAELNDMDEATRAAADLASALRALRSNLLNALLSGEHEIPLSYDALLEGAA